MKRIFAKLVLLLFAMTVSTATFAADNYITIDDFTICKGEVKTVNINMVIKEEAYNTAMQAYVFLPDGLNFVNQGTEKRPKWGKFTTDEDLFYVDGGSSVVMQTDGSILFSCYGSDFYGSGVLGSFQVTAEDTFEGGEIVVKKIMIVVKQTLPDLHVNVKYDSATSISNVASVMDNAVIYNLSGMKVAEPAKGIYIKDGKKFVK